MGFEFPLLGTAADLSALATCDLSLSLHVAILVSLGVCDSTVKKEPRMFDLEKFSEWMKSAGVPQQAGDAALAAVVSSAASPEAALKEIGEMAQGIAALLQAKDSSLGVAAIALGILSRLDRLSKGDEARNDALNGFLCFIAAGYRMQIELLPTEKEEKPKVAASPDPRLN